MRTRQLVIAVGRRPFATRWRALRLVACLTTSALLMGDAHAQMVHTSTPFQSMGSSYSGGASVGWAVHGPNWFANFGGGGPLLPPFGPSDLNSGLNGGFRFGGNDISGSLGFHLGQSSSRSIVSTTPSITTMDGVPGSISSGVIEPFVIGYTPIVGDYAGVMAPMETARAATDQLGQSQRSALLQSQIELQDRKLAQYLQRADRAESEGNKRVARANYRLAIGVAAEPLRSELQRRLYEMLRKPTE